EAAQDVKQPRLIETRLDRKRPGRVSFGPAALVAADIDVKRILSGRQVRVERLTAVSRVDPPAVEPIQPVSGSKFQRIGQLRDRVTDFQFGRTGRKRSRSIGSGAIVHFNPVDGDGRSWTWNGQRAWFDNGEAPARHEPQRAVAGANAIAVAGLHRE